MSGAPTSDSRVLHLSPSIAAVLLQRSPLHAWRQHSLGGNEKPEATDEMRRGKLIDRVLFETGPEVVVLDYDNWRTKDAQSKREEGEQCGAIVVLRHKYDDAEKAANLIRIELQERGIRTKGGGVHAQERLVWQSESVWCKGFADLVIWGDKGQDTCEIFDLKIVENAAPEALKLDLRASLQWASYVEAVETLHPEAAGRVRLSFIYAEPSGELNIAEPDGQFQALARSRWRRAVKSWGECLAAGKFPGYGREVVRLACKPWEFDAEMNAAIPTGGSPDLTF